MYRYQSWDLYARSTVITPSDHTIITDRPTELCGISPRESLLLTASLQDLTVLGQINLGSHQVVYEMIHIKSIKKVIFSTLFLLTFTPLMTGGLAETISPRNTTPVSESELLLGTVCRILIYDKAQRATFDAAFERIAEIEQKMSLTIDSSELVRVNAEGFQHPVKVSEDTFSVIEEALAIATLSDGAFDPTVGPLVKAWGIGSDTARIPTDEEISRLLQLVDFSAVDIDRTAATIALRRADMVLDLGGIAKGFAADEVARILRERGVKSAIVNLGGNILTLGRKPDGSLWRIGVQDPESPRGEFVMIVLVEDTAIVTSGPYERFFEQDGVVYHHILDTTTGYPVRNDIGSVSIISDDSFSADALSTAVFSLGLTRGMRLIESLEDVEAVIITDDRTIHLSSGFLQGKIEYELTDDRFTIAP